MNIITLTTDFGLKDHYVAVFKGQVLAGSPSAQFIDITHHIEPFNVQQAAYVLGVSWMQFPVGTVHTVAVNMHHTSELRCLFFGYKGHFFAGPDNGVFPLAIPQMPRDIFALPFQGNNVDQLATLTAGLAEGLSLTELGQPTGNMVVLQSLQNPVHSDLVKAHVVYIDHFGNLVLSVQKEEFEQWRRDRKVNIEFGKREHINRIASSYADVPEGERLCLFNRHGYLELAVNKGNAHELLGLKINDVVLIEFN